MRSGKTWSRHSILFAAIMLVLLILPVTKVSAAESTLTLNDQWVSGSVETGDVDWYTFYVPRASFVTIDYQGWNIRDSYVVVLSDDLATEYAKHNVYYSSDIDPKTKSMNFAFEAGTYRIKVYGYGNNAGTYKVKGSITPANNTETEPNNGFESAMPLSMNSSVTGFLSVQDRVDFYRITVPTTQKVKIIYTGRIPDAYYSVWDSNYLQKTRINVYTASETNPKTSTYEEVLSPGTYYIKIEPYSNNTGRYTLSWSVGKEELSSVNVTVPTMCYYQGTAVKPQVTVTHGNATLRQGVDYVVSYSNNNKVGTGTVTIQGTGAYQGTVTRSFSISLLKGTSFKKGNYTYKITNAANKTVQLTKVKSSATSITVPSSVSFGGVNLKVTAIASKACQKGKVKKVVIGKNVTSIGTKAFYKCSKLKTITVKATNLKSVGKQSLTGIYKKAVIKVPSAKYKTYKKLFSGKGQAKTVTIKK